MNKNTYIENNIHNGCMAIFWLYVSIVVCALIGLFVRCSASKKVVEEQHKKTEIEFRDSLSIDNSIKSYKYECVTDDVILDGMWIKINWSKPDSLGNQYKESEEQLIFNQKKNSVKEKGDSTIESITENKITSSNVIIEEDNKREVKKSINKSFPVWLIIISLFTIMLIIYLKRMNGFAILRIVKGLFKNARDQPNG